MNVKAVQKPRRNENIAKCLIHTQKCRMEATFTIYLKTELILGIFWGHAIKIMATYC